MRKNLLFTALAACLVLLASCTDNKELLANMVGTYCDNDPDEKVTVQFYPSEDGHTGRFVECRSTLLDGEDADGIELNIHVNTYVTGTFTLTDERRLSYEYDTDKVMCYFDTEDMEAYAKRNIEYNDANNNCFAYQGEELSDIINTLDNLLTEKNVESWVEFFESENKDFKTLSYSDVNCDGSTFSFSAGDEKVIYTRVKEDMFDADFFDSEKEAADEEEKVAEDDAATESVD